MAEKSSSIDATENGFVKIKEPNHRGVKAMPFIVGKKFHLLLYHLVIFYVNFLRPFFFIKNFNEMLYRKRDV